MPVNRREMIRRLRAMGLSGPHDGGRHQYMTDGRRRVTLPNPHGSQDIPDPLLYRILRQAGISRDAWDRAGRE